MRMQDALAAHSEAASISEAADVGRWYEEAVRHASGLPENARAVIDCPSPPVTSAGRRRAAEWILEFEPRGRRFIEPLMGWTGSTDTLTQVKLRFPNREAAISYARQHGLRYEVRKPTQVKRGDMASAQGLLPSATDPVPADIAWAWEAPHLALDRLFVASDTGAKAA
jgi:hypothetical protein